MSKKLHYGNDKPRILSDKERFFLFSPLILVVIGLVFFFKFHDPGEKYFDEVTVPSEFNGFVIKKYQESKNHAAPIIIVADKTGHINIRALDWIGLYEKTEISDKLIKKKDEKTITLLKGRKKPIIIYNRNDKTRSR